MKEFLEHKNIIYILIILILYTFIALLLGRLKYDKTDITKVDNYSFFYTLSNSLNTYLTYLSEENTEVYKIVEDEYKEKFGITKENVISKLKDFDIDTPSFRAEEMLYESVDKNINKYYVRGKLVSVGEDEYKIIKDYYLIIYVDSRNNTFMISPYDGSLFKGEQNE